MNVLALKKKVEKILASIPPEMKVTIVKYYVRPDAGWEEEAKARMDALVASKYDGVGVVLYLALETTDENLLTN
jgi:hypothetical protein